MTNSNEKVIVSARLSTAVVTALKNMNVPVSDVITSGVLHFLLLDDFDKVKFLIQNNEDVVDMSHLAHQYDNPIKWQEIVADALNLKDPAQAKNAIRELKSVVKNVDDRGEEVFFRKRIANLNATALRQEAHHLVMKSAHAEAALLYETALRLYEAERNSREAGKTLTLIGQCYQSLGRYSDALDAFEKARRIFEQHNMRHDLARVLLERGTCYQITGRYDEACASFDSSRLLSEALGNYEDVRKAFSHMGACLTYMGDKKRVLELYDMFIDRIIAQKKQIQASIKDSE